MNNHIPVDELTTGTEPGTLARLNPQILQSPTSSWWSRLKPATKSDLDKAVQIILMKVSQEAASLDALTAQLKTAQTNITNRLAVLKSAVDNLDEDLPDAAAAALDELTTEVESFGGIAPPTVPPATAPAS